MIPWGLVSIIHIGALDFFSEENWNYIEVNITFHLQIDGETKRVNGILNRYLKNYVNVDHKDWGDHLFLVDFLL
jgi:hypothetical protein